MNKVTTYDIARKAGVSQTAVSKILNKKDQMIGEETRQRVLRITKELNYQPNYLARSLKLGRTRCIGLMGSTTMADFNFPYFSDMAAAVENALADMTKDYSLNLFGANRHETLEKSLELIKKGMVDGLLIIVLSRDIATFEKHMKPLLDEYNIPFVVIHSLSRTLAYNNVGINSFKTGYLAGAHLCSLGHKNIKYYMLHEGTPQGAEILNGFKKALADQGIKWQNNIIQHKATVDPRNVYHAVYRTITELKEIPPALVAPTEGAAIGVYRALTDRGIRVPDETALVGLNDALPVTYFEEEITAVRHPINEKARAAMKMLLDILAGKKKRDEVYQETLEPWLEVRKST